MIKKRYNEINLKKTNLDDLMLIFKRHIDEKKSIILFGYFKVGKTKILNKISEITGIKINHRSDLTNLTFAKNLSSEKIILVDEATRFEPNFGKEDYEVAIVLTHYNPDMGIKYVKWLTGKDNYVIYDVR